MTGRPPSLESAIQSVDLSLLRVMEEGPERCALCRAPFAHNVVIYAGFAESGAVAIVGECCLEQMKETHGIGVTDRRSPASLDA